MTKPNLRGVPGGAPDVPLWDRPNLRPALGASDEKKTSNMEARVSPSRYRACQKLIEQRVLPEIETQSDIVQAGIGMVLDYASRFGRDSDVFRKALDVAKAEAEVEYILQYEDRMGRILDKIELGLKTAKDRKQNKKFAALFVQLIGMKDSIEDEGLTAKAQKLWVLYREYAKSISA